jgi:hypothetical protein
MDRVNSAFASISKEVNQHKLISLGVLVPYSKKLRDVRVFLTENCT